jgi:hypothetical protein
MMQMIDEITGLYTPSLPASARCVMQISFRRVCTTMRHTAASRHGLSDDDDDDNDI